MKTIWTPVIEDGIPIPLQDHSRGIPKPRYRLDLLRLKPGQSIFVPESVAPYRRLNSNVRNTGFRHRISFAMRDWTEDGISGTRIWRT